MFRTQGGALGSAQWSFISSFQEDILSIQGTEGKLEMSFFGVDNPIVTLNDGSSYEIVCPEPPECAHQPLVQSIVDELRSLSSAPSLAATSPSVASTGEAGLRTAAVVDAILRTYYKSRDDAFWNRPDTWSNAVPHASGVALETVDRHAQTLALMRASRARAVNDGILSLLGQY